MTEIAIWAKGLGKKYTIGKHRSVGTLGETLNNIITRPLHRKSVPIPASSKPFWALRDVSFELNQGEVLGIIGRNGSGKSTLLKMLSRITRPTEGSLEVHGRLRPLLEVGVGFHPELTGRENVYLNGSLMGMKRADINRRFDEIVEFSGIEDFIDTPVKFYSSGMYVRLAFSVSVHLEPDIILIDEVLAVGDVEFQKKCLKKIDQIRRQGHTIMLVSHNIMQLAELSSRVIWLDSGRIVEQGDARTVTSHYLASGLTSASMLPGEHSDGFVERVVPAGCATYDPPQGSDGVKILRAYVTDDKSQIVSVVPYEKPFFIVVEYEVETQSGGTRIGLKLYNERDQVVLHAATSDGFSPDGRLINMLGKHRIAAKIPGAMLTPSRFYVEIGIYSPGVGHHFVQGNAFTFDMLNAPLESVGTEILRPILNWDVSSIAPIANIDTPKIDAF